MRKTLRASIERGVPALLLLAGAALARPSHAAATPAPLYTPQQAVEDALSGPLKYMGRGTWFGISRLTGCGYRNDRVIVIDVYCTKKEFNTFSVQIFSPTHGRMLIYAEGKSPIIELKRQDYFGWSIESTPLDDSVGPIDLGYGFVEARDYMERLYEKYLPACYATTNVSHGGRESLAPGTGYRCLRSEERATQWQKAVHAFYEAPPASWYELIDKMRSRARGKGSGGHKVDGHKPAADESHPKKKRKKRRR